MVVSFKFLLDDHPETTRHQVHNSKSVVIVTVLLNLDFVIKCQSYGIVSSEKFRSNRETW